MTEQNQHTDGGTSPDLNEVLRLQAVALARMSERMDAHRTPGPKPLPSPPVERPAGGNLPVLASDAALTEDSLPVLNAFRDFLEQERRRTRARILWVSLSFAVVFGVAAAVVIWMGRERLLELRSDLGSTTRKVDQSLQDANAEMRKVSEAAGRTVTTIQRDVNATLHKTQSTIASNVAVEMQSRDAELGLLKEKLAALEIENAVLIGRLREADRAAAEAAEPVQDSEPEIVPDGEESCGKPDQAAAGTSVREETGLAMPPPDGGAPILIQTPAYNRPVRLKVPSLAQ